MSYGSRRLAATGLLLSIAVGAFGQTVVGILFEELRRYFGTAALLLAEAISGVPRLDASELKDRPQAREDLQALTTALSKLLASNEFLSANLSEYAEEARQFSSIPTSSRCSAAVSIHRNCPWCGVSALTQHFH
jgi:hypothetical protein